MRIAVYGNNLNQGYLFAHGLADLGHETRLYLLDYQYRQEHPDWWSDQTAIASLIRKIPMSTLPVGRKGRLVDEPVIREIYAEVAEMDAILMMEDGPAVFVELPGTAKLLVSNGADLQNFPFLLRTLHSPRQIIRRRIRDFVDRPRGWWKAFSACWWDAVEILRDARSQQRQRAGIRDMDLIVAAPYQDALLDELGVNRQQVRYVTFPMDAQVLAEVDSARIAELRRRYGRFSTVFLHPTRQHYLPLDDDPFLHGNDLLIDAYARHVRKTPAGESLLLLVRKGREEDIANTKAMIARHEIGDRVEWIPEMPNKELRAYYSLANVVVCVEYCPQLGIFGNVSREAAYFGRPTITSYHEWNRRYYGDDVPPQVYPADTVQGIEDALRATSRLTVEERAALAHASRAWFDRQLDARVVLPRFVALAEEAIQRRKAFRRTVQESP